MLPDGEDPADAEARLLLSLLGEAPLPALSPGSPRSLVESRLVGAAAVLSSLGGHAVDGPGLLGQRAALRGRTRPERHSRLLQTVDGWLAVTLSRPDDWDLVPAWLETDAVTWEGVSAAAALTTGAGLAARGQELGLAVAAVPVPGAGADEQLQVRHPAGVRPWLLTPGHDAPPAGRPKVVDLSALWAGPLCAHLLHTAGADVVTVESPGRPDGARVGDPSLYAVLHEGCSSVQLDLRSAELRELLDDADVVITSARPRALRQLGIWPPDEVARRPGLTWVAVTAYGLTGPWCDRVGYGDDTAAAGGLLLDGPELFADAAADPATGLYAAIAALAALRSGGGLVDIALREVAAHLARPA
ncbi:MAG: hypothetical protein JWN31_571 [Frankiales bacterium]|nr:hypothetical protein [Frankiales bacterium]